MLRNLISRLKFIQKLVNQTVTADVSSTGVDCESFGSMMFLATFAAFAADTSNKIALVLEYSDDNITFVPVPVAEMYDSETGVAGVVKVLDTAGEFATVHAVEYRGSKRYARLTLDVTGTVSVNAAVVSMGGYPELMPPL